MTLYQSPRDPDGQTVKNGNMVKIQEILWGPFNLSEKSEEKMEELSWIFAYAVILFAANHFDSIPML